MQQIHSVFTLLILGSISSSSWGLSIDEASVQIKNLTCKDTMSVEQVLDQSIRAHSQRDVGWRYFQEDGYIDVERAVLINKSMELRYRWRVKPDNSIKAETERAEKLCIND